MIILVHCGFMTGVFIGTMQKLREIYIQETTMSGSLPSSLGSTKCETLYTSMF